MQQSAIDDHNQDWGQCEPHRLVHCHCDNENKEKISVAHRCDLNQRYHTDKAVIRNAGEQRQQLNLNGCSEDRAHRHNQ